MNQLTGPSVKRHQSKQDYSTPRKFIAAVCRRFGAIQFDLAASAENAVCADFYSEARNSLVQDWGALSGVLWLNPPFDPIAPWAEKCASVRDRRGWTLLLTPASIGSAWFADHVKGKAMVLGLAPRLAFSGEPYPKDLMLSCFGFGVHGFDTWRWAP